MKTWSKVRLAWKFRRPLWKYRKLIRHRKAIAAGVLVGGAVAWGVIKLRRSRETVLLADAGGEVSVGRSPSENRDTALSAKAPTASAGC